ncbi:LamG-like jellyroll fold domain-containing protein [Paenibacillus cellulosilyticus]|uniref:LamG-like jellyroll fold domain-containing protein n=1 Tax=Paenibacillus cellulosilyticus TaxID=375489 RepID=UPI0015E85CFF|nr:LamG-like jellyroll fold domain-containing protein [Paenibacillus cellulosilyticus]
MLPGAYAEQVSVSDVQTSVEVQSAANAELDAITSTSYSFEQAEGSTVPNDIAGGEGAVLGSAASLVEDAERGGKVLNLPGGSADAGSWLTLPNNLFSAINGTDGFAISMWLKVPTNQNASYTRLFSASPNALGETYSGVNSWNDPELSVVRGGGDYNMRLFTGLAGNRSATDGADIQFEDPFKVDKWQQLVMTMKDDDYAVYLDGKKIADINSNMIKRFASTSIASVLPQFFDRSYLNQLENIAIGRSLYTSDGNFTGEIDDFKFYNRYLTAEDVAVISGAGNTDELAALLNQAKSINPDAYTSASYEHLQSIIDEVEALLGEESLSQGEIDAALEKLQGAVDNLKTPLSNELAPDYYYSFDAAPNENGQVLNETESGLYDAKLEGAAGTVIDAERGSVLNLPGGANGGGGSLSLPDTLFENVTAEDGFTAAMWVKLPNDVNGWSRLFDAGSADYGSNTPPFIYVSALNGSEVNTGDGKQYTGEYSIPKNEWVHIAYSIKGDQQIFYLNGSPLKTMEADSKIFDQLSGFVKNAVGRSRFSADPDLKGKIDDLMFYKHALGQDQIQALVGEAYNATLSGIKVKDELIPVATSQTTIYYPIAGVAQIPQLNEIIPHTTNAKATYSIEKNGIFGYAIKVTSANGKSSVTYSLLFADPAKGAVANFFMDQSTGPILHSATGFLYGTSEPNVPTMDMLQTLKPKVVVQKAPGGLQHPSGDGLRVSDSVLTAGVEQIQIYIQDMYYQWPYEYKGLDQYEQLAVDTVRQLKNDRNHDKYVYVIFNEPDGIWFGGNMDEDGFFSAFKRIYDAVKQEDPNARIAGPNLSGYNDDVMDGFMRYCKENNCVPDVMTWHELGNGQNDAFIDRWDDHYNHYRGLETKYGITPRQIVINEYSWFEDPGAAGSMILWLSRFEEKKVYGAIAYWHLANSLNELAADANKPNGAWWLYKWYAQMSGNTVPIETTNAKFDGLYGLSSIDNSTRTAYALFGGQDGVLTSTMHNLAGTDAFMDAEKVHVKLYRTKFTGYYGTLESPRVEFDGNVSLDQGNLSITVQDANALDGYFAIVTPATDAPPSQISDYNRVWTQTYEAEAAALGSGVTIGYTGGSPVSGGKYVNGMSSADQTVTFSVDVPEQGNYRMEVFYGNQAPLTDGKNRAQGQLAMQLLTIDGQPYENLVYDSTIKGDYFKSKVLLLDLTAGTHTLQFSKSGGTDATLDKVDLTYNGPTGSKVEPALVLEAEEADFGNSYQKAYVKEGFGSGGYIDGSGAVAFTAVVKENGYYDVELNVAAATAGSLNLYKQIAVHPADASTNSAIKTEWSQVGSLKFSSSNKFTSVKGPKLYLTAGVNTLKLQASTAVSIDSLKISVDTAATKANSIVIQAEKGQLFGTAAVVDNANASGGQWVTGIGESRQNGMSFDVTVPEAGAYKLSIDYVNNEPAPPIVTEAYPTGYIHPYNTDLVERYAQIVVNEGTPQTVYFINTLSWESVRNTVVDITLKAGKNTVKLYNDNSYRFSGVTQFAPYFDKFEIAKAYLAANSGSSTGGNSGGYTVESQGGTSSQDDVTTLIAVVPVVDPDTGRAVAEVTQSMLDQAIQATGEQNAGARVVTIQVPNIAGQSSYEIDIPAAYLSQTHASYSLRMNTSQGIVTLPANMLNSAEISGSKIIGIIISAADAGSMTDEAMQKIGNRPVIDLSLTSDGKVIKWRNANAKVTVAIPYNPTTEQLGNTNFLTVLYLNDDGGIMPVPSGRYDKQQGAVLFTTSHFSRYAVAYVHKTFADMASYGWAQDSVEALAARGIVNGVSDNEFMPGKHVTRADFVLLLVRALGLTAEGGSTFADVNGNSYYAEAVSVASQLGIVQGKGGNRFDPSAEVTRQEIMTFIARALKAANIEYKRGASSDIQAFKDSGDVDNYAKESAADMVSSGIVLGDGDRLKPLAPATRAEASVMIYRILQLTE